MIFYEFLRTLSPGRQTRTAHPLPVSAGARWPAAGSSFAWTLDGNLPTLRLFRDQQSHN